MEDLDSSNFDADTNGFSLIDVSASDDDFLFASSEANAVDNQGDIFGEGAHVDKSSILMAVQRPRKPGKCNLRKSLAWDSAFFTSAGVLDAEELSNIMEGAETGLIQNHLLPGIQEELSKSTDSITTFESDNLTLESIEADLFCDIRASIQRSSKSSNSENNNGEKESGNGCSRKIGQPSSGNMVKPKLPSRKLIPAVRGPATSRMLKPTSISKQVTKPVVRCRKSNLTLPQILAATGKPSLEGTAASKRTSVGANYAKSEINHAGNVKGDGKEALTSKGLRHVDSRNSFQRAPTSSKLSSASSVSSGTAIRSSHSSYDSSSNSSNTSTTIKPYSRNNLGSASSRSSSENIIKSLLDVRRKMDKNAHLPPGSKIRTPSRLPVKIKSQPGEFVKSTPKLSPSISPASSISEWSTESSSSNATLNQKHSNDRSLDNHDHQAVSMPSQSANQPSTGTASLARSGSAKPSGLRLPSPKIGFFDGAKAGPKTPSGGARSHSTLPSSLLRSAAGNHSPSGPANKAKSGSGRPETPKLDPQKSQASPKLTKQPQDHSVYSPSSNDPGTFSKVSKSTLAKSTLGRNNFADGENHSTGSQKDSVDKIVCSYTSIELPKSTSTISALERNSEVSEEAAGGKHSTEVSFIAFKDDFIVSNKEASEGMKLQSSLDQPIDVANDGPDMCTPLLPDMGVSQGTRSSFAAKNIVSDVFEVKAVTKTPSGSARSRSALPSSPSVLANKAKSGSVAVKVSTSAAGRPGITRLDPQKSHASPKRTKQLHDYSVDLPSGNDSGTFSDVTKTNLATSTLGRNSLVAEASDGEKHVADSNSVANNHSTGWQKDSFDKIFSDGSDTSIELSISTSIISALERNSDVSKEADGGKNSAEVSFIAKDHSEVAHSTGLQKDSFDNIVNDGSHPIELQISTSVISALEHNNDISEEADGGKHSAEDSFDKIVIDGSDTSIELPISTSTNSALECNNEVSEEADGVNHSAEYLFDKNVNDGSDTSIELPISSSINSALGRNNEVLEEADEGKHSAEDSFDKIVNDGFDTSIELLISTLIISALERNSEFSEEAVGGKHFAEHSFDKIVSDGSGTYIELPISTSINSALEHNSDVSKEADGGKNSAQVSFIAKNLSEVAHSTGLQKDSFDKIVNYGSDSIELQISTLVISALEHNNDVLEEADGGKHSAEDSFDKIVNDGSDTSIELPISTSTNSALERNNEVSEEADGGNHSAEYLFDKIVNDGSDTSIELPISTSVDSALERIYEVLEGVGGKHCAEVNFIAKDYLEFVLQASSAPNIGDEPETDSELLQCSSPKIGRDSEVADGTDGREHQDDCSLVFKDDFVISNREVDVANDGPTLLLTDMGVSQGTRPPFAVKNIVSDVVKESNSLTVSALEAFVKMDVMPSPKKDENSEREIVNDG